MDSWIPPHTNCVCAAIALLTLRTPKDVRAEIEASTLPGEAAFVEGGGCPDEVWQRYLRDRGWIEHKRATADAPLPPIPSTCLVAVPGHVFALVDGYLLRVGYADDVVPIECVWEPPDLVGLLPFFLEETKLND